MDKKAIQRYQELTSNACPANTIIFLNGWILRVSEGIMKRANSVLPLQYIGSDLLEDIKKVETIYRKRNLTPIFQIPDYFEPQNLEKTLFSRGYKSVDETIVMTAGIEDICTTVNDSYRYSLESEGRQLWFQALTDISGYNVSHIEGIRAIIKRIPFAKGFLYVKNGNEIVGIGRGVIDQDFLGIYSLIVHPLYRRKGIGLSMVDKLVEWGKMHSVHEVYLQVESNNSGAISLYRKAGFTERCRYRYFVI